MGDGSIRIEEDGTATLELSADSTADLIQYEIVDQPELGQLVGSNSQYEYVAFDDVNGTDTFTWRASTPDGESVSEVATVTVFIEPVNDAPFGNASVYSTDEDTPVSGTLEADDVDDPTLNFVLVSAPASGRVDVGTDGTFTYTPERNFVGFDSFLWSALDGAGASTGPVRVDVNVGGLNDVPVVESTAFTIVEDTPFNGQLEAFDADGDSLQWSVDRAPSRGSLEFSAALGTFTYTPELNFFGVDSFDVSALDSESTSEIATVNLTITAVNDRPTVTPFAVVTDEDVAIVDMALVAADVEGQTLSFRVDAPAQHGIVSLDPGAGTFSYQPNRDFNGQDDFTVIANDGLIDSLPGRITVSVAPINDAPRLVGPGLVTTREDVGTTGRVTGTDVENDLLAYSVSTPPTHGSVFLSAANGAFYYEPDLDYNGDDSFDLVVSDGMATSAPALLTVLVLPVNDAPRVSPATLEAVAGSSSSTILPAVDPEGSQLFFVLSQQPEFGTAQIDAVTGTVTYTADAGYAGPDLLRYTVSDGDLSSPGFLTITVLGDSDGDGTADRYDLCPDIPNADQSDVDGNGRGDRCDCVTEIFGPTLDPEFVTASSGVSPVSNPVVSPDSALRLGGPGAFFEVAAQPGCIDYMVRFHLSTPDGAAAPEIDDSLLVSVSSDGGAFETVTEIFGTGQGEDYYELVALSGPTIAAGSEVVFRFELVADALDDIFYLDDLFLGCDTDSDGLSDCLESTLPGYDLTQADADNDGLIDSEEYALGTDPNEADTDFDGVLDPVDNCPIDANPGQDDSDGNGVGDACDNIDLLLFYSFDDVGAVVPNLGGSAPAGTETATIVGSQTQGTQGICGPGALVGTGASSSTDFVDTAWATNLTGISWTISFRTSNIQPSSTLYYILGDSAATSFRCFTNGVAGAGNWMLRGPVTDITVPGSASVNPTMTTFVYDASAGTLKGYLDGVEVASVNQSPPTINGAGPFKVGAYSSSVGLSPGGLMDDFRIYNRALSAAEVAALFSSCTP